MLPTLRQYHIITQHAPLHHPSIQLSPFSRWVQPLKLKEPSAASKAIFSRGLAKHVVPSPAAANPPSISTGKPTRQTRTGRLRDLMNKYGYAAVGVYLALSCVDLGITFAAIKFAGADKVKRLEEKAKKQVKDWLGWESKPKAEEEKEWQSYMVRIVHYIFPEKHKTEDESSNGTDGDQPSFASLFAIAYAIHKTILLPVRVGLTAWITPPLVKKLQSMGWNLGRKALTKGRQALTCAERVPISLIEAQRDDGYIPESVMRDVLISFQRFQRLARDANVQQVRVIATEATRKANNSVQFVRAIEEITGWRVEILSKDEEAEVSTNGVIGSYHRPEGLVVDLGGGSVELNYVVLRDLPANGARDTTVSPFEMSVDATALPYGAASLKNRLESLPASKRLALLDEIVQQMQRARDNMQIPDRLLNKAESEGGFDIYMSGGGFRALGYMCMARPFTVPLHKKNGSSKSLPYPIPVINGYTIAGDELLDLAEQYKDADPDDLVQQLKVFRVSKRRARLIPACSWVVIAMWRVFKIRKVYFSEGGVRQGICFKMLTPEDKLKDPLIEGIRYYAQTMPTTMNSKESEDVYNLVCQAIPDYLRDPSTSPLSLHRLLPAAILLSNLTSHYPKESRAYVSYHTCLAGGFLSNVPGFTHADRARLALILAYRQGGEIADASLEAVKLVAGNEDIRGLCRYVGQILELVFAVSPLRPGLAGCVEGGIGLRFEWRQVKALDGFGTSYSFSNSKTTPPFHVVVSIPRGRNPLLQAPSVAAMFNELGGVSKDGDLVNALLDGMDADRLTASTASNLRRMSSGEEVIEGSNENSWSNLIKVGMKDYDIKSYQKMLYTRAYALTSDSLGFSSPAHLSQAKDAPEVDLDEYTALTESVHKENNIKRKPSGAFIQEQASETAPMQVPTLSYGAIKAT
ncbi:hypothetical protein BZG36_04200, partial [Bifiguratus adelaidae]